VDLEGAYAIRGLEERLARLEESLQRILERLDSLEESVRMLEAVGPDFDFDAECERRQT